MQRLWILTLIELKAWRRDPITILGGLIAPLVLLAGFGLLFSGELSFPIAIINQDGGEMGAVLVETIPEVLSPFDQPYFRVQPLSESEARAAWAAGQLDAFWVIPADFSQRLAAGRDPTFEVHFSNYMDDRAKNHRLYLAEVLWRFYEKIGQPGPPMALAEDYPQPEMVDWFSLIATGAVLLSVTLGAMFNIFMLTYKERVAGVTLELGLSPRPLALALAPKVILATLIGLLTGVILMIVLVLWVGLWPGKFLWAVLALCGLVALFWTALALALGLQARDFMAGPIGAILAGVIAFFVGGGLAPVRYYPPAAQTVAKVFPNTYAVDPVRDLMLFHSWPTDWGRAVMALLAFAAVAWLAAGVFAGRRLRRVG